MNESGIFSENVSVTVAFTTPGSGQDFERRVNRLFLRPDLLPGYMSDDGRVEIRLFEPLRMVQEEYGGVSLHISFAADEQDNGTTQGITGTAFGFWYEELAAGGLDVEISYGFHRYGIRSQQLEYKFRTAVARLVDYYPAAMDKILDYLRLYDFGSRTAESLPITTIDKQELGSNHKRWFYFNADVADVFAFLMDKEGIEDGRRIIEWTSGQFTSTALLEVLKTTKHEADIAITLTLVEKMEVGEDRARCLVENSRLGRMLFTEAGSRTCYGRLFVEQPSRAGRGKQDLLDCFRASGSIKDVWGGLINSWLSRPLERTTAFSRGELQDIENASGGEERGYGHRRTTLDKIERLMEVRQHARRNGGRPTRKKAYGLVNIDYDTVKKYTPVIHTKWDDWQSRWEDDWQQIVGWEALIREAN